MKYNFSKNPKIKKIKIVEKNVYWHISFSNFMNTIYMRKDQVQAF